MCVCLYISYVFAPPLSQRQPLIHKSKHQLIFACYLPIWIQPTLEQKSFDERDQHQICEESNEI